MLLSFSRISRRRRALAVAVFSALPMVPVFAGAPTGTFIDRDLPSDLRVAQFNVNNDSVFADVNSERNAKFKRFAAATDPDVWTFEEMYNHTAADVVNLMNAAQPLPGGASWFVYKNTEHAIASKYPLTLTRGDTSPIGYRPIAMAQVTLPAAYGRNLYIMDAHYKCCGGFDPERQQESDALVNWMRDARTAGGNVTLASGTAMVVMGDLNLVDGPQPLTTLLNGDIQNNTTYGADSIPDWDGTTNTDAHPLQNSVGPADWTWRDDNGPYAPGRLDYVTYTDSVMRMSNKFALNTTTMTAQQLALTGMQTYDSALGDDGKLFDHLPVMVDFRFSSAKTLTWNAPGNAWNTSSTNTNWLSGAASANFSVGDAVIFGNTGVGSVNIDAAGVSPGRVQVRNTNGTYTFSGGAITGTGDLIKSGAGSLVLGAANSFSGGITVASGVLTLAHADAAGTGSLTVLGGKTQLSPGLGKAVKVTALSVGTGATVDLTNNALVVDYSGATPFSTLRTLILRGLNAGGARWGGTGITSSTAAADASGAIGYIEASAIGTTSFAGRSVDSTAVLMRYTYGGDANLDGNVDTLDFNALAANFGSTGKLWHQGDFNYDGVVDTLDFNALAANFGKALPASDLGATSFVPEPASAMIVLACALFARRRRLG